MFDMDGTEVVIGSLITENFTTKWEVIGFKGIVCVVVNKITGETKEIVDCTLDCTWQVCS